VVSKAELNQVLHGPHTLVKVELLAGGGEGSSGYGMQMGAPTPPRPASLQ
jgi:hypothetical protein